MGVGELYQNRMLFRIVICQWSNGTENRDCRPGSGKDDHQKNKCWVGEAIYVCIQVRRRKPPLDLLLEYM